MKFLKRIGITTKFIFWFLFISLVPLVIAIYISYNTSRSILKEEIANNLAVVADNKAIQIETYLKEKKRRLTELSYRPEIIDAMERYLKAYRRAGIESQEYREVDREFRPFLEYYQRSSESVIPRGDIKSLYELALRTDSQLAKAFIQAKKTLKI